MGNKPLIFTMLSAIAMLSACSSMDYDETNDAIIIKHGTGGLLSEKQSQYAQFRESGKRLIIDGQVISADAFFAFGAKGALLLLCASSVISLNLLPIFLNLPGVNKVVRNTIGSFWSRAATGASLPRSWRCSAAGWRQSSTCRCWPAVRFIFMRASRSASRLG